MTHVQVNFSNRWDIGAEAKANTRQYSQGFFLAAAILAPWPLRLWGSYGGFRGACLPSLQARVWSEWQGAKISWDNPEYSNLIIWLFKEKFKF